jgi:hypothetical protein
LAPFAKACPAGQVFCGDVGAATSFALTAFMSFMVFCGDVGAATSFALAAFMSFMPSNLTQNPAQAEQ